MAGKAGVSSRAVNLFTGLTTNQIYSVILTFMLFNGYVVGIIVALVSFYLTVRPRLGYVRTASLWHLGAVFWFLMAEVSLVWAAPAEKSFFTQGDTVRAFPDFPLQGFAHGFNHLEAIALGLVFAVIGGLFILVGWFQSRSQRLRRVPAASAEVAQPT